MKSPKKQILDFGFVEAEREDLSILTYFAWCMLFPFIQESGRLASFVQNTRWGVQLGKFVHKTQLHSQQTPIWKRMAIVMQHCMENYQIQKNSDNFIATAEKKHHIQLHIYLFPLDPLGLVVGKEVVGWGWRWR